VKFSLNKQCPCGSGQKYKKCCKLFHNGKVAKNALELMRSRYSAYVVGDTKYIMKTTHPANHDYKENSDEWAKSIEEFTQETEFKRLDILEFINGKDEAFVAFKANISQDDIDVSFKEKSRFLKVDGKWLYESGEFING